jgi:hypothetical protein
MAVIVPILCWGSLAQALMVVERDQFFVYFSEAQAGIATRLLEACLPMATFLKDRGLAVQRPVHIILDDHLDRPQVQTHMIPQPGDTHTRQGPRGAGRRVPGR